MQSQQIFIRELTKENDQNMNNIILHQVGLCKVRGQVEMKTKNSILGDDDLWWPS